MALVVHLQCPLCGWTRPKPYGFSVKKMEERSPEFAKMVVATTPVWQMREMRGAGRGSKNAVIRTVETKTLRELPAELKAQIKAQCEAILAELSQ